MCLPVDPFLKICTKQPSIFNEHSSIKVIAHLSEGFNRITISTKESLLS